MKPLKPVKVLRWLSDALYKVYIFDKNNNTTYDDQVTVIKENIYQDDNMEYALEKIAYYISNIDNITLLPFYAWNKKRPLLFDIETIKWKGYHINPFKSKDRNAEELKEPIIYNYKHSLFDTTHVNIVFFNDFKEKNKYYFTDYKTSFSNLTKRELILNELFNKDIIYTKILYEKYHRIDLFDTLKTPMDLSILFDSLHTTKDIQLIQLVNDNFKLLYKLHKKHSLTEKFLANVFNLDKVRQYGCINLFSIMSNGTYCKITIDNIGIITLSYILDLRSSINWNDLSLNKNMILKYINNFAKQKIILKEKYIKMNIYYNIDNSSFAILSKKIGEYIDIFHVVKLFNEKNKNKITCIYKRTNNYNKEPININEYIQSRLNLGINDKELVIELINLGISEPDAKILVKNEIEMINVIQQNDLIKNKIDSTGTLVTIEQYKQGYLIDISNCPSKQDLNHLIYWLTRIIESTRKVVKKELKQVKPISPPVNVVEPNSFKSTSSEQSDDNIGDINLDLGSDDDFFQGGALGKQKHGYFINMLRNADKNLFSKNYARDKCQAAKQPLVLTKQEKENLEKQDMLKYFDNIISHGSTPSIKNYYACPRIWCPESKIPLDYTKDDLKCPLENEEPMKLFWDKDKTIPRFVKLTEPDENGISVPCCFKKELDKKGKIAKQKIQKEEPEKNINNFEKNSKDNDENYIMNKTAPIPIGRYGIVPESLYKLLMPNVNFVLCSKSLNKVEKCLVRKGILHKTQKKHNTKKDSVLYAVSYLLGFKSKAALIKDIINRLDIITYMSLEDGNICKDFLDLEAIIPENNKKLCHQFMQTLKNHKLLDISDLNCNKPSYKLSRLLNIYKSYTKFIDYLSSDDYPTDKGVYYLNSLISILYNTLLLVWEKTDNEINLICPYYTSFTDILSGLDLNPKSIMIMKEGEYYEPLELKLRNNDGDKMLKLNDFPNIKNILGECTKIKQMNNDNQIYNNLMILYQYTKTQIYKKPNDFKFKTIIINNDLTINKLMTNSNVLVKINPISISLLPNLIKNLEIQNIKFYDDIIGNSYNIRLLKSDLNQLSSKLKEYNMNIDMGTVNLQTNEEIYSTMILMKQELSSDNIIHVATHNPYHNYIETDIKQTKRWFQLQKLVVTKIINTFNDKKLEELLKLKRPDIIKKLLNMFTKVADKQYLQIILEELPLYSIDDLKNWMTNIILYDKYDYYSGKINENKTEFLFSQYHVNNNIPKIFLTYHKSLPNNSFEKPEINLYKIKTQEKLNVDILPSIYNGIPEKLKSKWTKHKKMVWNQMTLLRRKYTKDTIPDLFKWISNLLGYSLDYKENIAIITNNKYFEIINNDSVMADLFYDPSFYHEYIKSMNIINKTNKKFKTLNLFFETYFNKSSPTERKQILVDIINKNTLYPNDIDILSMSELLNISILTIHRTKYGDTDDNIKRGEVDDLVSSSTLFPAKTNIMSRPLVILGKEYDKTHSSYYAIIEKNKNIYLQLKDAHPNIKMLVENHLQ